jgi:uncharacterized membrane protein
MKSNMPIRTFAVLVALLIACVPVETRAGQGGGPSPRIQLLDLGLLAPGGTTVAAAVNDGGVVVGTAESADGRRATAFTWTRASGLTAILERATAWDINNRNQVVGTRYEACDFYRSCIAGGFVWSASEGARDLGAFFPYAINNRGDMAGVCGSPVELAQACARIDGAVHVIGPTEYGVAFDINERGTVVGWAYRRVEDGGLAPLAFTWSLRDGVQFLDPGDADHSIAYAISSRGIVVGSVTYDGVGARVIAAAWDRAGLLTISSGRGSTVWGISERGWAVGFIATGQAGAQPLLWTGRTETVLPTGGAVAGFATDVNNAGLITGYVHTNASTRAVIWLVR